MADAISIQELIDARTDADSLEKFVNGDSSQDVLTRLNSSYPTLQKAIRQMFEGGALPATMCKTYGSMSASGLTDGSYANVVGDIDTSKNGYYIKESDGYKYLSYNEKFKGAKTVISLHQKYTINNTKNIIFANTIGLSAKTVDVRDKVQVRVKFSALNNGTTITLKAMYYSKPDVVTAGIDDEPNVIAKENIYWDTTQDYDETFDVSECEGFAMVMVVRDYHNATGLTTNVTLLAHPFYTNSILANPELTEFKNIVSSGLQELNNKIEAVKADKTSATTPVASFFNLSEPKKIELPPVAGVTGGTHPSVIYYPERLFGYKYWMAYTPYPGVENENPCILVSDDGLNFETPDGLSNPLEGRPPAPAYYSDVELVLVHEIELRCYWRLHTATEAPNKLLYKKTNDGINWSETIECTLPTGVDPLSPSIIRYYGRNDHKFYMWVGGQVNEPHTLRRYESINGLEWTNETNCITNIDENGQSWHPMVWATPTGFHCISAIRNAARHETYRTNTDLYYGKSRDGINWVFDENPSFARSQFGIKNNRVYRSCAVRVGGKYKLYISGLDANQEWIHVVDADKLGEIANW